MSNQTENRQGGSSFWKVLSIFGILAAALFAYISYNLKKKNDEYRDALISMSDEISDVAEEEENRRQWHRAHAPSNRKTVEERLEDQRIRESE